MDKSKAKQSTATLVPAWYFSASGIILSVVLSLVFCWAYRPTLERLWTAWSEEPDYSHGFLVIPCAGLFLWVKRYSCPRPVPAWSGLVVIALSVLMRVFSAHYHAAPADGWSIVICLMGLVLLLCGLPVLRWSSPAILFLIFMVPLPYRVERLLNGPLRDLSTHTSCFLLQTIGEPAFAVDNTIWLPNGALHVERACSGLRILVGMLALSTAVAICVRGWLERIAIVLAVTPIAVLTNSLRVVITGLLLEHFPGQASAHFSHDVSGWLSLVVGACFFLMFWGWLGVLFPLVPEEGLEGLIHRQLSRQESLKRPPQGSSAQMPNLDPSSR